MLMSASRAPASSGRGLPIACSARLTSASRASVPSGRKTSTRARDNKAALSSNEGFSVVAPMSVIEPSSITGRKESCCARLKRWISSTNSSVPCPCARRARAASKIFFSSATPVWIAETWTNASSRDAPIRRATVVLPLPGGPQKIIEPSDGALSRRVSAPSGPVRCSWPETSASDRRPQPLGERRRRRLGLGAQGVEQAHGASKGFMGRLSRAGGLLSSRYARLPAACGRPIVRHSSNPRAFG